MMIPVMGGSVILMPCTGFNSLVNFTHRHGVTVFNSDIVVILEKLLKRPVFSKGHFMHVRFRHGACAAGIH